MAVARTKSQRAPGHSRLRAADYDRLQAALGHGAVDLRRSLFGAQTVSWRVNREAALLLGGGCALLLQVAHPLVAAGVAAHSEFKAHPLQRLWRTLDLMLTITFADAARAIRAVRQIERVHARVRGTLETGVGPFPRGTRYDASDPALLFWVHATLVDTAMRVYEIFVGQLTSDDKAAYYDESKIIARLFGIPAEHIPPNLRAFRDYMKTTIHDVLVVGPAARDIAASILDPPLPLGLRQGFHLPNLLTIGLLPPVLRGRYGFAWGAGREVAMHALVTATQLLLLLVPNVVRVLPHARRAARHVEYA